MKITMKSVLFIILIGITLVVSLNIVHAAFRRGGDDTYYEFVACTDGLDYTIGHKSTSDINTDRLYGILNLDNSLVLDIDPLVLSDGPITITDTMPITLTVSGHASVPWGKTLQPGDRVGLHLELGTVTNIKQPFMVTVRNCSLANLPPDRDSFINLDPDTDTQFTEIPYGGLDCSIDVLTSTITVPPVSPGLQVSDVNVSLYMTDDPATTPGFMVSAVRARLKHGNTTVKLFEDVAEVGTTNEYTFGTRGHDITNPGLPSTLIGDPMGDFILDDDSVYSFYHGDPAPANRAHPPFNKTAVQPDENLSAFIGQPPDGIWTLEICKKIEDAEPFGKLLTWYVEIEMDEPTCYALTRSFTGGTDAGSQPTALPANSTGCDTGEYVADESIDVTAHPATGYYVDSWNGTDNDTSQSNSNTVTMPASPHTVTANYVEGAPTCYALTLDYTGTGSQPTALPANSTGCDSGEYVAGESIEITAYPDTGHHVGSWTGTNNDASTASTNVVFMPAGDHTVTANYVEDSAKYPIYLPAILKN